MKFEDVDKNVYDLFEVVKDEYFPELEGALFKLVFRTKRKGSDDFLTIAEICSTGELVRFFTAEEAKSEDGYDYIILIDKNIYEVLEEEDKKRIIRHELRHCNVDIEKDDRSRWKIRRHTIEDFYEDVAIESQTDGDPRWKERIVQIGASIYDEIAEKEKAEKKNKKREKN